MVTGIDDADLGFETYPAFWALHSRSQITPIVYILIIFLRKARLF